MRTGMVAEFLSPEEMIHALWDLRARGYRDLDAFTPYPIKGAVEAIGQKRSNLGWPVFAIALGGAATAYLIQWFCNAYDYPLNVGGRSLHAAPAWIPITFEMGVLSAGISALVLYFWTAGLPELYSPIFDVEGFDRALIDRFWVGVDERDPSFDRDKLERELKDLGAARVAFAGARQ